MPPRVSPVPSIPPAPEPWAQDTRRAAALHSVPAFVPAAPPVPTRSRPPVPSAPPRGLRRAALAAAWALALLGAWLIAGASL